MLILEKHLTLECRTDQVASYAEGLEKNIRMLLDNDRPLIVFDSNSTLEQTIDRAVYEKKKYFKEDKKELERYLYDTMYSDNVDYDREKTLLENLQEAYELEKGEDLYDVAYNFMQTDFKEALISNLKEVLFNYIVDKTASFFKSLDYRTCFLLDTHYTDGLYSAVYDKIHRAAEKFSSSIDSSTAEEVNRTIETIINDIKSDIKNADKTPTP